MKEDNPVGICDELFLGTNRRLGRIVALRSLTIKKSETFFSRLRQLSVVLILFLYVRFTLKRAVI